MKRRGGHCLTSELRCDQDAVIILHESKLTKEVAECTDQYAL